MPSFDRVDSLAHEIERLVEEHWNTTGRAFLASNIGKVLRKRFDDFSYIVPNGLIKFLALKPIVKYIIYPGVPEKIGLIPLGVAVPDAVESLFEEVQKVNEEEKAGLETGFSDVFWKSFHRPLREPRFVVFDKATRLFHITNSLKDKLPEEEAFEINHDDISRPSLDTPMSERVAATREKIQSWLDRNSLAKADFVKTNYRGYPIEGKRNAPAALERNLSFSGITNAISRLSQDDLSRILVPLDIVLKML